jgi:hypothetical protein
VEGTLYKKLPDGTNAVEWGGASVKPRYLIIAYKLPRAQSTTQAESPLHVTRDQLWTSLPARNNIGWSLDVRRVWPKIASEAKLRESLSPECQKVFDLPGAVQPRLAIAGTTHHPTGGLMALAPLSVAFDVATSPFQLIGYALLATHPQ